MASPGDIFRLTVNYSVPNASIPQNVFVWALEGSGVSDTEVKDALEAFFVDDVAPAWALLGSIACEMTHAVLDVLNNDGTINRALGSFVIGQAGVATGEVTSAAVSAFLMANTAVPKIKGKKYWPGLGEGKIDSGKMSTASVTAMGYLLIFYLATVTVVTGTTLAPGVLSRSLEYFVPFAASGLVNDIPAYQRRRKPGVGS